MQKSIIKDKFPAEYQNKTKNRYDAYYHQGEFPDLEYKYYIEESFAVDVIFSNSYQKRDSTQKIGQ